VTARERHTRLVAEAAGLGLSMDPKNPGKILRATKRGAREDSELIAHQTAKEIIAFAREMKAIEESGEEPDAKTQERITDIIERMTSLDAAQLKIVIAEVRAAPDLDDEMRVGIIGFSIMTLSTDNPRAALAIYTESADLFKDKFMGEHVISTSLDNWAKDDPMSAIAWVKENGKKFPELISDDAKNGLIAGAATNDPKLAFQLIGELGIENSSDAVRKIFSAATSPEQRGATLSALREHLATVNNPEHHREIEKQALHELARSVSQQGFDSASTWVATADLTPSEVRAFADGLHGSVKNADTGKWVEWIGEALPDGSGDVSIRSLVNNWTQTDYQAAGTWLADAAAGPAKNPAIRAYAETVSKYDPNTAAQWALTLPPGEDRDQTLQQIYQNWPKQDEAGKQAAETFKQEHGIK